MDVQFAILLYYSSHQGGYVFVCICLYVTRITQKVHHTHTQHKSL